MKALLVVDLQNDFLPGGALAVHGGWEIVPIIDRLVCAPFDLKIATKDWHPYDHGSFASVHGKSPGECVVLQGVNQTLWPVHCVQGSLGAEFASGWDVHQIQKVIYKGTDKDIDSYSTFFDNKHLKSTGLHDLLRAHGIRDVYIVGLATDYCVKYSVLDAVSLGYNAYVVTDACKGVDLRPGDSEMALQEMRSAGAHLIHSQDVLNLLKC